MWRTKTVVSTDSFRVKTKWSGTVLYYVVKLSPSWSTWWVVRLLQLVAAQDVEIKNTWERLISVSPSSCSRRSDSRRGREHAVFCVWHLLCIYILSLRISDRRPYYRLDRYYRPKQTRRAPAYSSRCFLTAKTGHAPLFCGMQREYRKYSTDRQRRYCEYSALNAALKFVSSIHLLKNIMISCKLPDVHHYVLKAHPHARTFNIISNIGSFLVPFLEYDTWLKRLYVTNFHSATILDFWHSSVKQCSSYKSFHLGTLKMKIWIFKLVPSGEDMVVKSVLRIEE